MENPNYSFLNKNKKYRPIYDMCCMIDYAYANSKNDYWSVIVLSRVILERVLKLKLKSHKVQDKELYDLIELYSKKAHLNKGDEFYKNLNSIRINGNEAVHGETISVEVANKILPILRDSIDQLLNINAFLNEYKFPNFDDEWISGLKKNQEDIGKFITDFADFECYKSKIIQLEREATLFKKNDEYINSIKNQFVDLQKKIDENENYKIELDKFSDEINSLKENILDASDIKNSLETINKIKNDLGDFEDVKSTIDDLNGFKGEYSFLKQDINFIKDKYSEFDELKKDIDKLNEINVDSITNLTDKINKIEELVNAGNVEDLKEKIDELYLLNEDYENIQLLNSNIDNIKDKIAYIFEDKLSREQFNAVRSRATKLIINAGPGAGKTRVLVERVKYLINEKNVDPKSLLIITFTEKAAKEIEFRLNNDVDISYEKIDQMQIGTIHSFCRTFLRKYVSSGIEVIDDENNEKKILFIKKNLDNLIEDKYTYFTNLELKKLAKRFDEFATFDIDPKKVENYIKGKYFRKGNIKNEKAYCDFIDKAIEDTGKFPISGIENNSKFKKRLLVHNFLAITKAYDQYKCLFDKRKSYDFNLLQSKTRDYLKDMDKRKVDYKNILIDEFQDTDRVQFEIFELLAEYSETVTYVGDINQSIYRWRGSNLRNFKNLINNENDFEVVNLLTNYRSPKNIVEFNNHFMVDEMELKSDNPNNGDLYYLNSLDNGQQAKKIVQVIKYLKESNKIKNYSDIGLLFRSKNSVQIEPLLNELDANNINYNIKGFSDFKEYPEVQAIILLLWYLSNSMIEDNVFNLREFENEELNKVMFKLSSETREFMKNYNGSPQEFSKMNETQLKELGITNESDLTFFNELNKLKTNFCNENKSNSVDLLALYYNLLKITGFVVDTFENIDDDKIDSDSGLLNLALFSNKINDFMETYDRYDLDSFFEFIFSYYVEYSSPANMVDSNDMVQISTIHAAKGLEFPVVFICSLSDGSFPFKKPFKTKLENYDIPNKFKHHEIVEELEDNGEDVTLNLKKKLKKEFYDEEKRVLYVGLTRAQSTLIVSHVLNKKESVEFTQMKTLNPSFEELTLDNFDNLNEVNSKEEIKDDLELSFTSLEYYNQCPRLFNLIHNYKFINPQNIGMRIGTIIHSVLNKINKEIMNNPNNEISEEFIRHVINEAIESNPDLKDNDIFEELLDAVETYCDDVNINIIEDSSYGSGSGDSMNSEEESSVIKGTVNESEYPFTIPWYDGKLRGSVDLILGYDDDFIDLVDFKISDDEGIGEFIEKYYDQLHFYFMAMNQSSKYSCTSENTNLKIYSLSETEFIDVTLDEDRIEKLNENLKEVSKKINKKEYNPVDEESCESCLLKSLCCK